MENLTRRSFVGAAAAMAAMPVVNVAFADEATPAAEAAGLYEQIAIDEDIAAATGWTGTPKEIEQLGGSTMPLEAINMYRQKYLDLYGDYTCADGTVIPAVFTKVRALINTYGVGRGHVQNDMMYADIMKVMSEDDAQAFIDMPWGVEFRPLDMSVKSGRPVERCAELCERLCNEGYLFRVKTSAGNYYHQMGFTQGIVEPRLLKETNEHRYDPATTVLNIFGADAYELDQAHDGSFLVRTLPCSTDLVIDSGVAPYDDVEQIFDNQVLFAIGPCSCRYPTLPMYGVEDYPSLDEFLAGECEDYISPVANRRVETCIYMGDEAEYAISCGNAREITREQAREYVQRSRDEGFLLQKLFTKSAQVLCSCEPGSCYVLMGYLALGQNAAKSRAFQQSRGSYEVVVDSEACAKCGTCAQRCPLGVVYMDEETGLPALGSEAVGPLCFGCGQCAYVCPTGARALKPRPAEEVLELPDCILDDHNMKVAYRFEHGMMGL